MEGLSLVIPAHNGEQVIENSIKKYYSTFIKQFNNFEIIVVSNDSNDNTADICRRLSSEFPVKIIEIPQRGKGYALIKGLTKVRFDYIGFLDADNAFDLNLVSKMVPRLKDYDVIIASKYKRGTAKTQDSFLRRMLSLNGSIFSKIFLNLRFRDTQAGCKFFKKSVWDSINKNLTCIGFDFDMEFLYKVNKKGFKILEFYVPVRQDKFSTFRLKYLPGMLKRLLIMRFLKPQKSKIFDGSQETEVF
jgi:dolichol-phosphate mannosyltransferase